MESVILEDSPLAAYLEGTMMTTLGHKDVFGSFLIFLLGQGEAESGESQQLHNTPPTSPESLSFAPQGPPKATIKARRKLPAALKLDTPSSFELVSRFHHSCSRALNSRLGRSENAQFLERFRYTIIASQLLDGQADVVGHSRRHGRQKSKTISIQQEEGYAAANVTTAGLLSTGGVAFVVAASVAWARSIVRERSSPWQICLMLFVCALGSTIIYAHFRRHWLHSLRNRAVEGASELVASMQSFESIARAAITLVQEVELVSRGYRVSSPLPPVTRLEEQSQARRCARLRRTLSSRLFLLLVPIIGAYDSLRPLAVQSDLERYYDMYEISRTDMQELEEVAESKAPETEEVGNLKTLKVLWQQLHTARKLFFCSLLAMDADGGKPDFSNWKHVTETLKDISSRTADAAQHIDTILDEEERFTVPLTPAAPLTPSRERMRGQVRKLGALSHGIRSLQARMHILREESDQALEASDDLANFGPNLLVHYDAIGADLKTLMQEWEDGRVVLTANIDKNEIRQSMSPAGLLFPPFITSTDIKGLTAVQGSPAEALRILNGESGDNRDVPSSDEEVFEAIALPRQRSTLTREERIQKMKDDRAQQASAREKSDASTKMLKELETVIKLRPQGKDSRRATTAM